MRKPERHYNDNNRNVVAEYLQSDHKRFFLRMCGLTELEKIAEYYGLTKHFHVARDGKYKHYGPSQMIRRIVLAERGEELQDGDIKDHEKIFQWI